MIVGWRREEIQKHVIYPAWKGKWHMRVKLLHNSARTHISDASSLRSRTSWHPFFYFLERLSFQVKPVDADLRSSRFYNHIAAMKLTDFLLDRCIFASGNVIKCSWVMTHQNIRFHDLSGPIWGLFCCKDDSTVTFWRCLVCNQRAAGCLHGQRLFILAIVSQETW